jgi:uncharacterized protein involved in exopolysaccharide biosynthesis
MAQEQQQELEKIKKILWRRKWWFLLPFVVTLAITGVTCVVLPDIFKSTATVLIMNQQIPSTLVPSTVTTYAQERIESITQEVMSRSRIFKLIEKYNLIPKKREKLTAEDQVEAIRKRITFQTINAEINKENASQPVLLTVAFSLSYEDENPKIAQAVTNEIVSFYLEKNLESRAKVARGTTDFLTEQLNLEKERMDELQGKLAQFQEKNLEELPEYAALNMQKLERYSQRLSDITMQIRTLDEQRSILKGNQAILDPYSANGAKVLSPAERLQQAQLELAQLASKYSEQHPVVEEKKQEIALLEAEAPAKDKQDQLIDSLKTAEAKLASLKSRYSDQHPDVQSAQREIQKIKDEIAAARDKPQSNSNMKSVLANATNPAYVGLQSELAKIDISVSSLKAEQAQIEKEMKELSEKLHTMPIVGKQFLEMDREYQASKVNYATIQQKLLAARVSQGMEEDKKGESFQVVEPAFEPEKPAKPNRIAIMLVGAVLGIGLSVGVAALKEFSDNRLYDLDTLENISGFRVLSAIPPIVLPEDLVRIRRRRMIVGLMSLCGIVCALVAFHLFVMDFDIFFAKLGRLIQRRI